MACNHTLYVLNTSHSMVPNLCLIEGRRDYCGESSVNGLATVLGIQEKYPYVHTVSSSKMFNAGSS